MTAAIARILVVLALVGSCGCGAAPSNEIRHADSNGVAPPNAPSAEARPAEDPELDPVVKELAAAKRYRINDDDIRRMTAADKRALIAAIDPTRLPADRLAFDEAIQQMAKREGVSEEKLRQMPPAELQRRANAFLAEKFGVVEDTVKRMNKSELEAEAVRAIARKYGISLEEARAMFKIIEKTDNGLPLSAEEERVLRTVTRKLGAKE